MRPTPTRLIATVLVATFAAVALGACGDDDDDGAAADPTTTVAGATTPDATDPAPAGDVAVMTGETDLGTVLVDSEGFTLYIFTQDSANESTCAVGCIEIWPAAAVDGDVVVGEGLDESRFGTIERDDGTTQLTVNERPLYRYAPDSAPGDTTGQGLAGVWFVVDADGEPIE